MISFIDIVIFVITIVSIHLYGFPLDLSPVVVLKLIIPFLSQLIHCFISIRAIVKT